MADPGPAPESVKIVVAGGFGAGKTTLVCAVSEISPMVTEERLTALSEPVDDLAGIEDKTTTTVAMDFGRRTIEGIEGNMVLYLFGTPGQDRFWFMWNELSRAAVGAVVLVDVRRIQSSFAAVDYFEKHGIPFVVVINMFGGRCDYPPDAVRAALDLADGVPIMARDVRDPAQARDALITLVDHALSRLPDLAAP